MLRSSLESRTSGGAGGNLWRLAVYGAEDQYEWERFLRSMPGEPQWAVCDGSSAIANAVRAVWPGAIIYNCEWHIARSGTEKLRPSDPGDAYQLLLGLVKRSAQGPDPWADLERAVAQVPDVRPRFEKWLRRQRKALPLLWARRIDDMPYSSGPLEEAFDEINRSIPHRRFRLRNLGRLECVLAMMPLHQNHVVDERRYVAIITDYASPAATMRGRRVKRTPPPRGQAPVLSVRTRRYHPNTRRIGRRWPSRRPRD
jgi:hypothetical protein